MISCILNMMFWIKSWFDIAISCMISVQFTDDIIPYLTDIRWYIMGYIMAFISIRAAPGWTLVGAARCFDREIGSENVYESISSRSAESPVPSAAKAVAETADGSGGPPRPPHHPSVRQGLPHLEPHCTIPRACASSMPCSPSSWTRWACRTWRLQPPRQKQRHEDRQCSVGTVIQPPGLPGRK